MSWSHTFGGLSGTIPLSYLDDNFGDAVLLSSVKVKQQVFTASGTYTPTAGMIYCDVQLQAAGGGGGGVGGSSTGAGASAGAFCQKVFSASDIGASQTITLGANGVGVSGAAGTDAGDSTFGLLLTAGGGKKGSGPGTPGAFTSASGGDVNINGSQGGFGVSITGLFLGGDGGDSVLGFGGKGNRLTSSFANGLAGRGYGGGGAGSVSTSTTSTAGGDGAPAICIVTEFIAASS